MIYIDDTDERKTVHTIIVKGTVFEVYMRVANKNDILTKTESHDSKEIFQNLSLYLLRF